MHLSKFIFFSGVLLLSLAACSKKESHSAPAAQPPQTTTNFYINNNTCYDSNTHQPTAMNNCQTTNSGGTGQPQYQWVNQVCVDTQTGWVTNIQNCTTASGPCIGNYIYVNADGYSYDVYCDGGNCSGLGLYDVRSGFYLRCQ